MRLLLDTPVWLWWQMVPERVDAAAAERMLESAGRAVRWNAIVLALGFLVLTLSALKPNHSLGLLLSASMCVCYTVSLLLLPWLLRNGRSQGPEA